MDVHSVSIFRRIGARISIHGGITVDSNNVDFKQWKKTHVVKINGKEAQEDQYLLIWYALNNGGHARSSKDSQKYEWDATVNDRIYQGSSGIKQTINIEKRLSSGGGGGEGTFTLSTQNCLYGNVNATQFSELTVFEREMIPKTRGNVKAKNLYWSNRAPLIVRNVCINTHPPDILLLQETSPKMFSSLNKLLGGPYNHVLSQVGDMGGGLTMEGHCIVAWNSNDFKIVNTINPGKGRIIAVELQHKASNKKVVVVSVHLPASGINNASTITTELLQQWPLTPIIIGGDFNVGYNPFEGFDNISGKQITFFNDCDEKFDWVVANHNVTSSQVKVNTDLSSRWPNEKEGSDHTSIRMTISLG